MISPLCSLSRILSRPFPAAAPILILAAAALSTPSTFAQESAPQDFGSRFQQQRIFLGVWAEPIPGGQEKSIEALEAPPPAGVGRRFALHLHYFAWTDLQGELDSNGKFMPDEGLAGDIANARVPVVSWVCDQNPNYTDTDQLIASGDPAEDATIRATARALRQFPGPVILRWFWEFNQVDKNFTCRGDDGKNATQQSYDGFIAAWRHIRLLFLEERAFNVIFLWNPGSYAADGDKRDPHPYYPGNDYVDWIGLDNYQAVPTGGTDTDSFSDDFGLFYSDFSKPYFGFKPLMVGENGANAYDPTTGELQKPYLAGLLSDIESGKYPLLRAYDYFDQLGKNGDWVLDDHGGLAEFTTLAHSRAFSAYACRPEWGFCHTDPFLNY
jgi:hypothetical protein